MRKRVALVMLLLLLTACTITTRIEPTLLIPTPALLPTVTPTAINVSPLAAATWEPSGACDIKGLDGVYYVPQDSAYNDVEIGPQTGAVWLCSIKEALEAGYVPR